MGTIFCDPTHINLNTQRTIAKFHVARTLKHASAASQESPFSMSPLPTILQKSMPSMAIAFLLLTNSGIGLRAGLRFYLGQTRSEPEFWLRLVYPFIFWIYSRIDRHRCTDDVEPKAIPSINRPVRAKQLSRVDRGWLYCTALPPHLPGFRSAITNTTFAAPQLALYRNTNIAQINTYHQINNPPSPQLQINITKYNPIQILTPTAF